MQRFFLVVFFLFCGISLSFGQYYDNDASISTEPRTVVKRFETQTWKTAFSAPKDELHLSILAPVRYGLSSTVEVQSYLGLWAYLIPNIYVKKNWYAERWVLSSKHGLYYPTIALKNSRDDGENSTLHKGAEVAQFFTFQNEFIASYVLNPTCNSEVPYWIATGRFGFDISTTGEPDASFNRMTFYSLYHRTASFYGDNVAYVGLQLDGGLWERIYFNAGADIYAVTGNLLSGIEAQGNFIYHYNQRLSFSAGVKYIKTNNPIESESHILPVLDVCYRLGRKGGWQKGLFGKKNGLEVGR